VDVKVEGHDPETEPNFNPHGVGFEIGENGLQRSICHRTGLTIVRTRARDSFVIVGKAEAKFFCLWSIAEHEEHIPII
jgi:hypothetical protein